MAESFNPVSMPALQLEARRLQAERGGRILFAELSFSLRSGELLVLRGANGAGKSSLLRIIAGLDAPLKGEIALAAQSLKQILPMHIFCHYLSDKNSCLPQLSVRRNLEFWQGFFGAPADKTAAAAAIEAALESVHMSAYAELPFAALSTGQQRRIGFCRLQLSPRPLWLLDEPTSGLDAAGSRLFADLCAGHLAAGGLIAAATHLPLGVQAAAELNLEDYRPQHNQLCDLPAEDWPKESRHVY